MSRFATLALAAVLSTFAVPAFAAVHAPVVAVRHEGNGEKKAFPIAADEFRHYKLFYEHLRRCLQRDRLSKWARLRVGWSRIAESEDDELAYAYFAANEPEGAVYDRKRSMEAYAKRAYPLYRATHVQRAIAMVLKAIGLEPQGRLNAWLTRAGLWFLRRRSTRLAETAS